MEETVAINAQFLKKRIGDLDLRMWWIAEQIQVDRKTISRWVNGRVKWAKTQNIEALCEILEVSFDDLVLKDLTDTSASRADLIHAAELIFKKDMTKMVAPGFNWDLLEYCIKASLNETLPLNLLSRLYYDLALACFSQYKINESIAYIDRSIEISLRIKNDISYWEAVQRKATILTTYGSLNEAIELLRQGDQHIVDPENKFRAKHNIVEALWLKGEYQSSYENALEQYKNQNLINDKIARCKSCIAVGKPLMYLGRYDESVKYLDEAQDIAESISYIRGRYYIEALKLVCESFADPNEAQIDRFEVVFDRLKSVFDDPYWYYLGSIIYRENGLYSRSIELSDEAAKRSKELNTELGMIYQDKTLTLLRIGNRKAAKRSYSKAVAHLKVAEARHRIEYLDKQMKASSALSIQH